MMERPKIACCNFIADPRALKEFALTHQFDGVDWSFNQENLPQSPAEESALVKIIAGLHPLEVRYHCAFSRTDLGDVDDGRAAAAMLVFRRVCRLVSKLRGRYLTIHVGLGRNSTNNLSWNRTIEGLTELVRFANGMGVRLCLENLAWGWTSRPELFEKMIRKSGAWATFDIGHAQVSPYVTSQHYELQDFVHPQPDRFLNAHIYHEEQGETHVPVTSLVQVRDRLELLDQLKNCQWWVLELRREEDLLKTLAVVREYVLSRNDGYSAGAGAAPRLPAFDGPERTLGVL